MNAPSLPEIVRMSAPMVAEINAARSRTGRKLGWNHRAGSVRVFEMIGRREVVLADWQPFADALQFVGAL